MVTDVEIITVNYYVVEYSFYLFIFFFEKVFTLVNTVIIYINVDFQVEIFQSD